MAKVLNGISVRLTELRLVYAYAIRDAIKSLYAPYLRLTQLDTQTKVGD